jgi:hypothetical protein
MSTRTLNEIDRALKRLESQFERGFTSIPNPLPGAVPESQTLGSDGLPNAEMAQVMGLPGITVFLPALCNVLVARVKHGQDPVIIAGTGTPAALAALKAITANPAYIALLAGGIVILDPLLGTGGLIITPTGVTVIGTLALTPTVATPPVNETLAASTGVW